MKKAKPSKPRPPLGSCVGGHVLPDMIRQVSKTTGRRTDPRIARSKKLLVEALQRLTRERCFEDITVQDILESATINRATFYSHFEDKHSLLHYLLSDFFQQTLRQRVPPDAPPGPKMFREMIAAICHFLTAVRTCPSLGSPANDPTAANAIRPLVRETLLAWAARCTAPDQVFDAEFNAEVATAAICTAVMRWTRSDGAWTPDDLTQKLSPLVAHCLGLPRTGAMPSARRPARGRPAPPPSIRDHHRIVPLVEA